MRGSFPSSTLTDMDIEGSNPLLPQDIITNILIRLPVKSLFRFQCVCKFWKNLFKTPSFIAEHLHHSSHQNPYLLFEDFCKSDLFRLCLLDDEMQILEVPTNPLFDVKGFCLWTLGSCNGLLCIGFFSSSLSLLVWNPATREVRRLPRSISYFEGKESYIGFGFSPIVDDYKIVKINAQEDDDRVNEVKVYSLSIGSWKDVQFGNLDGVGITSNGFCFNGAIFWIGYKIDLEEDEDEVGWIVSFDIAMEVFALIPMPSSLFSIKNTPYSRYLTAHENKLALLCHTLSGDFKSSLIHLWVMEEGTCASRERWVWTKKYISSPYLGYLLVPVAIWRNQIVCIVATSLSEPIDIIEDDEREFLLVNLTTYEFKVSDIRKSVLGHGIFNYSERLVPVGNIHTE
ncbi:hypothetical protein QN277_005724 [Acacia crassicarpa]|uniref:F-box domain-containing protein n=1 Tax=Acacia crassicarpa TaxID=499986 RepID=A0AAE1IWV8_9FABA|nr:hypothetical protein QN277_005724 [Acacia crassicarpa]